MLCKYFSRPSFAFSFRLSSTLDRFDSWQTATECILSRLHTSRQFFTFRFVSKFLLCAVGRTVVGGETLITTISTENENMKESDTFSENSNLDVDRRVNWEIEQHMHCVVSVTLPPDTARSSDVLPQNIKNYLREQCAIFSHRSNNRIAHRRRHVFSIRNPFKDLWSGSSAMRAVVPSHSLRNKMFFFFNFICSPTTDAHSTQTVLHFECYTYMHSIAHGSFLFVYDALI